LRLKGNIARRRATRALDRLRDNLATRGVDSSAAALASPVLAAVVWQAVPQTLSSAELAMLRTENERINRIVRVETLPERARVVTQAAAAHSAARSASAPERSLPSAAAEPAAGAKSPSGADRSIRGHTFHGQDTVANAGLSFAYASDATDGDVYEDPFRDVANQPDWFGCSGTR
jgi:hypothetical protein